jgi:hypothetical protein
VGGEKGIREKGEEGKRKGRGKGSRKLDIGQEDWERGDGMREEEGEKGQWIWYGKTIQQAIMKDQYDVEGTHG